MSLQAPRISTRSFSQFFHATWTSRKTSRHSICAKAAAPASVGAAGACGMSVDLLRIADSQPLDRADNRSRRRLFASRGGWRRLCSPTHAAPALACTSPPLCVVIASLLWPSPPRIYANLGNVHPHACACANSLCLLFHNQKASPSAPRACSTLAIEPHQVCARGG